MKRTVRRRFWLETGLASLTGALAIVTLLWRDWIEAVTGFNPDHHSGSAEWAIVAGLAVVSLALFLAARAEWRRSRAVAAASAG